MADHTTPSPVDGDDKTLDGADKVIEGTAADPTLDAAEPHASAAPEADASESPAGKAPEIKAITNIPAEEDPGSADRSVKTGSSLILVGTSKTKANGPASATIEHARRKPFFDWLGSRAATIAIAAGLGAAVGSLASNGLGYAIGVASVDPDPAQALRASISQLASEVASLKVAVGATETASANDFAEDQPIDTADPLPVAQQQTFAGLKAAEEPVSREITGSVKTQSLPVARDWTLWRVKNGRALVEAKGAYYEVAPGSTLPRLGRVQRIVRQDGRWMVQTRNGIILPRG